MFLYHNDAILTILPISRHLIAMNDYKKGAGNTAQLRGYVLFSVFFIQPRSIGSVQMVLGNEVHMEIGAFIRQTKWRNSRWKNRHRADTVLNLMLRIF